MEKTFGVSFMPPIITLLTDFGLKDSYVAEMKAVILSLCPEAVIVDISHEVEPFNVKMGAYLLARAAPYFPRGTIHVAIVDPGVGGPRKPLIVEAERGMLVGPDNGLLIPAARKLGLKRIFEIKGEGLLPKRFTETFHGRDIFAPTAALLAKGVSPETLGLEVSSPVEEAFHEASLSNQQVSGEIVYVDRFGNLVTNIDRGLVEALGAGFGSQLKISLEGRSPIKVRFVKSYSEAPRGGLLALIGSWGTLELSANQASASEILKASAGMKILVELA